MAGNSPAWVLQPLARSIPRSRIEGALDEPDVADGAIAMMQVLVVNLHSVGVLRLRELFGIRTISGLLRQTISLHIA